MKGPIKKSWNEVANDRILPREDERLVICKIRILERDRKRIVQIVALDDQHGDAWYVDSTGEMRFDRYSQNADRVSKMYLESDFAGRLVSRDKIARLIQVARELVERDSDISEIDLSNHKEIRSIVESSIEGARLPCMYMIPPVERHESF